MKESIGSAIPHIISLLCCSNSNVRKTAADVLRDFSLCKISNFLTLNMIDEVIVGFDELLRSSIPQIISLMDEDNSYSRYGGASALSRLSERSKSLIF